jgi:unconventional prefoldin RPB5 interactor 1
MTKYLEDYKVLSKQLTTIADKISYDVMVPFGPKAFFPGKLRHTNEGTNS